MPLNFPNSPSLNDTYTFGNKTWIWNGAAWKLKTDGAINNIPIGNSSPSTGAFTTLSATGTFTGTTINAAQIGNLGATLTGTLNTAAQPNVTSLGTLTGLTLSGTLTGTAINAATIGNSGALLTGTLQTAAQTNITSVGTLTGLTLSGTLTGTSVSAATIGNAAAVIIGDGSALTSLTGANVTGTVANATYAIEASNSNTANSAITAGTANQVIDATQSNITAVGTLTGLTLSGTLTGTTIEAATIGNTGATLTGTLSTAAQPNVTSLGTLTGLTLSGTLTGTTLEAAQIGNTGTTLTGTISTAAQTNITSLGVLTGLTLSGTLTGTAVQAATIGNTGAVITANTGIFLEDITANGNIILNNRQEIHFYDTDSSNWVGFRAPSSIAADILWSLPNADGTPNQILSTDGAKNLFWAAPGGGSSGFVNSTITTAPGDGENYDLAKPTDQTQPPETPFEAGGADPFG